MSLLKVSPSPHAHGEMTVKQIMYSVIFALLPALAVSIFFFGFDALRVSILAVGFCLAIEWAIQKFLLKGDVCITDGSAIITGLLLAFNVPSNLPWWIIMIGCIVSIGIAKMSFGGLGKNPFNPALIGRVFLLVSFPADMTTWPLNRFEQLAHPDAVTGATSLGILKEGLKKGESLSAIFQHIPSNIQLFLGNHGGSLGEISALAIIIGGLFLLLRKVITWHIPFTYLATVFTFTGILFLINPERFASPIFHLVSGGLMLGAFFMATDMVTTPMSAKGMIIFGLGCGVITTIIRVWGAYPEGVSFAILIMNAATPLINLGFKPKKFGEVRNG
ncbi:MAG: RnfABCDGE type electron transport complex subunit D [Bacteroidota bacterium]|nr:RnfABCDGE type electron transport complex subunit D [Bacteroidota bacterium]